MQKRLADDYVVVARSPDPMNVYCFSPGLCVLPNGRLIATMDYSGPGVADYPGRVEFKKGSGRYQVGRVFVSDDKGATWREKATVSMLLMRPFLAGDALYVIGCSPDLGVARSDDGGETFSEVFHFSENQIWHQAPSNVWYKGDFVYLAYERETDLSHPWPMDGNAPILMRGNVHDDLTKKENWTFANELVFNREIDEDAIPEWGIPFHAHVPGGYMADTRVGWLETNVVQLLKPNDVFTDPTGHTFHLFCRTSTGLTWPGAMIKVVEKEDGTMETTFEYAPSGKRILFVPIPGGGDSKFHILFDEKTRIYWLLSNQFTDSMADFNRMSQVERHGYDRSRLVLHYSYNCFDWLFAGVVATGRTLRESRSYASMAIDGDDLLILSRSCDEKAKNGHDNDLITFHRVKAFRSLADRYDGIRLLEE